MALANGAMPPLFSLLQADGSRFELAQSLGRDRILIAFGPSLGWMQSIARREHDLADYQLQVLVLAPLATIWDALVDAPPASSWLHIGLVQDEVLEAYGVQSQSSTAFLIGKDRGLKRVYEGRVSLDEVLALIDTMPMRQAEARRD